jgi:hypothetical protein
MSALPPKADMVRHAGNVCFVPEADISQVSLLGLLPRHPITAPVDF